MVRCVKIAPSRAKLEEYRFCLFYIFFRVLISSGDGHECWWQCLWRWRPWWLRRQRWRYKIVLGVGCCESDARPPFTERTDVLPQDLVKSRGRDILVHTSQSPCNLTGTPATALPRCLSNFGAMRYLRHPIARLRGVMRFGGKTSYCLVTR